MRKLQWLNAILSLKKKEIKIPAILVLICVDHLGFYVAQVNHLEVDRFYVCYAAENLRRMLLVLLWSNQMLVLASTLLFLVVIMTMKISGWLSKAFKTFQACKNKKMAHGLGTMESKMISI